MTAITESRSTTYCVQCGVVTAPTARFCASCGARVPEAPAGEATPLPSEPSAEETSRWWNAAAVPLLAASGFTIAALFPAYYRGGPSLASDGPTLGYNILFIVGWLVAGVLVAIPRTRVVGAGFAVGATGCFVPAYIADIGQLANGDQHLATGMILGLTGVVLAVVGSVAALVRVRPSVRANGAIWAVCAGIVGIAFSIGDAMPWNEVGVHSTTGTTFAVSGTADYAWQCCTLLQIHGWDRAGEIALIIVAVCLPVVAACLKPVRFGVAMLVGAAFALAAGPLFAVFGLMTTKTPAWIGMTAEDVAAFRPTIAAHGLVGLWLALVAASLLVLVAVGRGLSSSTDQTV